MSSSEEGEVGGYSAWSMRKVMVQLGSGCRVHSRSKQKT